MRHTNRIATARRNLASALLAGASCAALVMAAPDLALAADHAANDEASFKAAVTAVNSDPDSTASITLTGDVAIADIATVPALTRAVTINTGAFDLNDGRFNSSGALSLTGSGVASLAGSNALGGNLTVTGNTLRLNSGVTLTTPTLTSLAGASTLWLSGAGSMLTTNEFRFGASAGTAGVQIENGGVFHSTYTGTTVQPFGQFAGAQVNVNITGAGSLMDVDGQLGIGTTAAAAASVTISNGGALTGGGTMRIGSAIALSPTPPSVLVTGAGSSLNAPALALSQGTFDVRDGGAVAVSSFSVGGANGIARLLVSGPGSSVTSSGGFTVSSATMGSATLTDGGALSVGGLVTLTSGVGRVGVINIGGAEASPAAGAGVLNANSLTFGAGTARLNFNHTETSYDFDAAIIGGGAINQLAGVTHLTANSTAFSGLATVSGGELHVDGVLGDATSTVTVTGGMLGGSGTLGGDLTVGAGGILAPGSSPGTLTIGGDLTLLAGSTLNMEFGQAGVAGGGLNDLVVVGGDLTLDGTINVAESAGGVFGNGVYRIIDYTGALTDNGLDVGTLPRGSATVQTSIANQVNLLVTGGGGGGGGGSGGGGGGPPPPTFSFWDGDGGSAADGQVTGGSGVWSRGGSAWTNADATINGAYSEPSFAIFGGTGGVVTVDASGGPIAASGLQFAADGYRLTGGTIALGTPEATLRVGDGTAAGAGFTAVIASELTGVTRVVKDDLGTLVLTGANTYAGGTTIAAGTLQIGDGGTSGSILGDVADAGRLVFDRSDVVTFGGVVSGSGSLTQAGTGALVLTADNTYAGGTTIAGGSLRLGDGGATGSVQGDIVDNGALVFDRSNVMTIAGTISGAGAVRQAGAGTTVLTAANSYAGGTTIAAGTLQLGDGGTTGSITGDVANDGTLAFNRADAVTFSGLISGSGAVRQMGAGTLTLGAANTYAGGTTISGGTLLGAAASFGSGAIQDDAALVIDQPGDATLANALNGAGSVTKLGAGRLTYTGVGGLSGLTDVRAGVLAVNGSLAGSAVTVRAGAALAGSGAVGSTTLEAGSTVSPGDRGLGTLRVNGAFSQAAGVTYQLQVDPAAGASDRIDVAGAATLAPGAVLNVTRVGSGGYRMGQRFTVMTAAGGLSGAFQLAGDVGALSAFLGLHDHYDATDAYLSVEQVRALADAAGTPNQQAAAAGADSLAADNGVRAALVNLADDAAARAAFDQLSGEAYASGKAVLVQQSGMIRDAALARLSSCARPELTAGDGSCERPAGWAQVIGGWGKLDGDRNAAKVDHSTAGFLLGADAPLGHWRLGAFAGYTRSNWDVDARAAKGDSQDYHLGVYAGRELGGLSLGVGGALAWHEIDADRAVAFPGFGQSLQAGYEARTAQAFGDLTYRLTAGGFDWSPFVNVAHLRLRTDGFTETGGSAALANDGDTLSQTATTLGVRPSTRLSLGGTEARLRASLGWRHAFGDVTPTAVAAFDGGQTFTVSGAALARDAAALDLRLELPFGARGMAGVSYGGQYSGKATEHRFRAELRVQF